MREWLPFSRYDLYAYLPAGAILLATVDYTLGEGALVKIEGWSNVQTIVWLFVAYVTGHLIAGPSAALLEHAVARTLLHPPVAILLGLRTPRLRERIISALFCGHYYRPLPANVRAIALSRAVTAEKGVSANSPDPDAIFQMAFARARKSPDTADRIDQFRNLYGFSRNLSFVGMTAAILLIVRLSLAPSTDTLLLLAGAVVLSVGAFGRFVKFYSAFAAETLRAFSFDTARDRP